MIVLIPASQYGAAYLFWDWPAIKTVYRDFQIKEISKKLSIVSCDRMEFLAVAAENRKEIPEQLRYWAEKKGWKSPYKIKLLDRRKRPFPGADYPLVVEFKG
jgi:hypothetical protein